MTTPVFDSAIFDPVLFGGQGELFDDAVFDNALFDIADPIIATWNGVVQGNVTLSGGDLTITRVSSTSRARATRRLPGKSFYSVTITNPGGSTAVGIGIDAVTAFAGEDTRSIGLFANGFVGWNETYVNSIGGALVNGDVIDIAWDHDAGLAWFRRNGGNWNNSGTANPATGTGGWAYALAASQPGVYPVANLGSVTGAALTANFGATAYTYPAPAGFASFEPSLGGSVTLNPPRIGTGTLFSPSVAPGAISIQPPLLAASGALFAPTVTRGAISVAPPLLGPNGSLFAPTITSGAASLLPPLLTTAGALFAPTLTVGAITLGAPIIGGAGSLFAPTVTRGAVSVSPPVLLANGVLFAPGLTIGGISLAAPLLVAGGSVFAPTVSLAPASIRPPILEALGGLFGPEVSLGAIAVAPPVLVSGATLFSPAVAPSVYSGPQPVAVTGRWPRQRVTGRMGSLSASGVFHAPVPVQGRADTVTARGTSRSVTRQGRVQTIGRQGVFPKAAPKTGTWGG